MSTKVHFKRGALAYPLSHEMAKEWIEELPPVGHPADQTLFYKGHQSYGLYVLQSGTLLFTKNPKGKGPGKKVTAPAMIGLMQTLEDKPYPYTAVTATDVKVCFLPKSLLRDWVSKRVPLLSDYVETSSKGRIRSQR